MLRLWKYLWPQTTVQVNKRPRKTSISILWNLFTLEVLSRTNRQCRAEKQVEKFTLFMCLFLFICWRVASCYVIEKTKFSIWQHFTGKIYAFGDKSRFMNEFNKCFLIFFENYKIIICLNEMQLRFQTNSIKSSWRNKWFLSVVITSIAAKKENHRIFIEMNTSTTLL